MSTHLDRAFILFQQSRPELAEAELRRELTSEPNSPVAHALLSMCLTDREELQSATDAAQAAIAHAPDMPLAHYALAKALAARNHWKEAEQAIGEAIRLDPDDAGQYALLSSIHFQQRRWDNALEAAQDGLAVQPENVSCANLRAMALVKLGRRAEAGATIGAALAKDPENALSHANQGWTLLESGQPAKAMEHFREALRLDPDLDWARQGIVEALKARHFIYRVILSYFLWMSRLSAQAQWGILIGGYIGVRFLRNLGDDNPQLAPIVLPITIAYTAFAIMTWIADPLFNLLLRLNRFGRLALSREQLLASNLVGGLIVAAVIALVAAIPTRNLQFLMLALVLALLILPTVGIFRCSSGWPRWTMAAGTLFLALLGLGALSPMLVGPSVFSNGLTMFFIGIIASTWGANALASVTPRR